VVEVVKKANPQAKILISLGGWADSAGDKYSRYSYSILKYSRYNQFSSTPSTPGTIIKFSSD
jgi:GH18 family chitinase